MATILIVANDRRMVSGLQRQLTRLGHTVLRPVAAAAVALAMVRVFQPEAVFLDLQRPGDLDGLTLGGLIEAAGIPVIYLSDAPGAPRPSAPQGRALRFSLTKPLAEDAVVRTLEWAVQYGLVGRVLRTLRQHLAEQRRQATLLQAEVKEFIRQVHEFGEHLEGRDPAPAEEPRRPLTVLVVEDLEAIRDVVTELLVGEGYRVLTAGGAAGAEAVRAGMGLAALGLVITELRLTRPPEAPEGVAWIRRWHALDPALRFILMSGHVDVPEVPDLPVTAVRHLRKPFARQTFLDTVRAAIRA